MSYIPSIAQQFQEYREGRIEYSTFRFLAVQNVLQVPRTAEGRYGGELPIDCLCFGPDGFHNEPFFCPSLYYPTKKLTVFTLMLKRNVFDTISVQHSVFPWCLQYDVVLGATYLRDALYQLRPKRVFFGDSSAILMTHKLAKTLYDMPKRSGLDDAVLRILEDSMEFPPTYPPLGLSKLIPGHETFAPQQIVIAEDDGFRSIRPNMSALVDAWNILGRNRLAFVKKEYTEGGRAVAAFDNLAEAEKALARVFERNGGVGIVDQDLKTRLLLQRGVPLSKYTPTVFRFFSHHGKLITGHLSKVVVATRVAGIAFVTERHALAEQHATAFIKMRNYTGFGTLKFWIAENEAHMLDFNPRFERQQCINAVLIEKFGKSEKEEERGLIMRDPCSVFQLWVTGHTFAEGELPIFLPAGISFMDPMRVQNLGKVPEAARYIDMLYDSTYIWNLHRTDVDLWNLHYRFIEGHVREWKEMFPGKAK
jgi:hypothetical protein